MKRKAGLIAAGGLTTIVLIIVLGLGFTTFITPTWASQADAANNSSGPQVDVAATAQAIQFQNQQAEAQKIMQEREAALQAQIVQSQRAITDLDNVSQAQMARLRAEMIDLKAQIDQTTANIQAAQNHANQLQQVIQNDDTTYKNQLTSIQTKMTQAEQQAKIDLENTYAQIQSAYNEIAARQMAAAQSGGGSNDGGGGSGGGGSKDGGNDGGGEHEQEHEDHGDEGGDD